MSIVPLKPGESVTDTEDAFQKAGGVEGDAENPGPQVQDLVQLVARPPALDERLLGRVLGVVTHHGVGELLMMRQAAQSHA